MNLAVPVALSLNQAIMFEMAHEKAPLPDDGRLSGFF
jgi:hypothetical protein